MSETEDLRAAGDRIEQLLDQLASLPDRRAGQWGEELVRLVTDLYGAGLEATIALAAAPDAPRGRGLLDRLAEDELVASILLVHDLHPQSLRQRIERAFDGLRTAVPAADVRLVHLDEQNATLRVRLAISGDQARTSGAAIERRVREAIDSVAPDLQSVEVDRLLPPTPVNFRRLQTRESGSGNGAAGVTQHDATAQADAH